MKDTMQDAGLGVPRFQSLPDGGKPGQVLAFNGDGEMVWANPPGGEVPDTQIASDFADLEGERVQRVDRWVNWGFTLLIVAGALAAVFWPGAK